MLKYFILDISHIPAGTISDGERCDLGIHSDLFDSEKIKAIKQTDEGEANLNLTIEDNGIIGDGLRLSIHADSDYTEIVSLAIPDTSIDIIIEALTAVKRLRETQKED